MNTQTASTLRRFLGNRAAVVAAGTVGFLLGAGGFVAAQHGADDLTPETTEVETTVENTIDDNGIDNPATHDVDDDSTSTSLPGNDDDSTSTSVPVVLPDAFTETYQSAGGSISVSWSGTAFSINSISPAAGFEAEIEDNAWNRVRVDFESAEGNSGEGRNDSRIEVRLSEGRIRVNIS